jgi:hypothetical protein
MDQMSRLIVERRRRGRGSLAAGITLISYGVEGSVGGEQRQLFDLSLCDEQTIERVGAACDTPARLAMPRSVTPGGP